MQAYTLKSYDVYMKIYGNWRNFMLLYDNRLRKKDIGEISVFHFFQNSLNDKTFSQEDQMKTFLENFLSLKPAEIYLRGINKLPDK